MKENISILVFTIKYSDDCDEYSANWMNCEFVDQRFFEVPKGTTVADLCSVFIDHEHPEAYMMRPYISFTAEGIIKTSKPTIFYDGKVKPEDMNRVLDGTEVYHLIRSNQDGSNIKDFLYLK